MAKIRVAQGIYNKEIKELENKRNTEIAQLQAKANHWFAVEKIQKAIELFKTMLDPDDPAGLWTRGQMIFVKDRFKGLALYEDGSFEEYTNDGRVNDPNHGSRKPMAILQKFDYYDAVDIIGNLTVTKAEKNRRLQTMLDEFKPL